MPTFILSASLAAVLFSGVFVWLALFLGKNKDLKEKNKRLEALKKLDEIMLTSSTNLKEVAQKVTDAISFEFGFTNGVLALIDEDKRVLRRVAMSRTQTGVESQKVLPVAYEKIEIPLYFDQNLTIKAIKTSQRQITHDLYDLFVPILDRETAKTIQNMVDVRTSLVYPIRARGKTIGVMIFSLSRTDGQLSEYEREVIENLVYIVGIALDNAGLFQDLKDTSIKLEQVNQKLKELDKLKDDFVSIASHELRTPMTAIRSYAWMALNRSDIPLSEKLKKYLARTLISTERLINLVNDMLNISRIESGRIEIAPKAFDIRKLLDEVLLEVAAKAKEKDIRFIIPSNKSFQVFADPDKLHQVLLNLIGNAMKFTPEEGSITISFLADGEVVETSIKDSGVGISEDDLSRLFKKFGRLDNSYVAAATSGGTGLGLYICKSLIELMKGKIWVKSEGLGKGATFSFSLPQVTPKVMGHSANYAVKVEGEIKNLEPVAI